MKSAGPAIGIAVTLTACTGLVLERVHDAAAPVIKCPAESQEVTRRHSDSIGFIWTAKGCGREAECTYERPSEMVCHETADSRRRREELGAKADAAAEEMAVVERLAMETGCAEANIRVIKAGAWSTAGQRSFRLDACGKPFVCSAGRSGADCKEAMTMSPDAG
jgi:hypothetical protein